jgi:hypothetical protein
MISSFLAGALAGAHAGESVFITDVRAALDSLPRQEPIHFLLALPDGVNIKYFKVSLPADEPATELELKFITNFVEAEVYNHLTTLGGISLEVYVNLEASWAQEIAEGLIETFGINTSRAERVGYARITNVADRMQNALYPPSSDGKLKKFEINIHSSDEFPGAPAPYQFQAPRTNVFADVASGLEDRIICGLDVGGTDIKAAISVRGRLAGLKEYDWNPATFGRAEELIDPVVAIASLLRARVSLDELPPNSERNALAKVVEQAMRKDAELTDIQNAVIQAEEVLGDSLIPLDAIGLCFPDVVVKNKVVGGEVPKTKGMRDNTAIDFEDQFSKITDIDERLMEVCRKDGAVMITNDGPMASFTAAVELAASPDAHQIADGVFAHTLGTDLGTGLVLGDGTIPEIPLEAYNMVVDLGSFPARKMPAADARSMNNTNTGIAGTLQRFTSQTGAFRLAMKYFPTDRPDLIEEIRTAGYIRSLSEDDQVLEVVPESPQDMRKALLAHLMELTTREHDAATERVFREIGMFLAVVWQETEYILQTGISSRFLFGRLVKVSRCFDLMCEGAAERESQVELIAADGEMAFTPLMKALDAEADYTVAQFGQAIGAVYFGNLGLL